MIKRCLDFEKILKHKSYFLLGPRQTGKSYWIKKTMSKYKTYDLLKPDVFNRLSANPSLLINELTKKDKIVIIDEIQKMPILLDVVHSLIEDLHINFLLTGSSARKLMSKGINLLGGRARRIYFHPLTFIELKKKFNLEKALNIGLIPSIYFSDEPEKDLESYVGIYLKEEIAAEGLSRKLNAFSRFLEVAALCNGEQINYNQIASDAEVPRTTVQEYFQILKDTLIANELPCWQETLKRKPIATSKFYFFDFGVVRKLQKLSTILPKSPLWGKAFESYIYHELKTYCDYHGIDNLHFWRTSNGIEVDFILNNNAAIEVKASDKFRESDLNNLIKLSEEKKLKYYILINQYDRPLNSIHHKNIKILPWNLFLEQLWDGKYV
ncbi:MAG: ATP-binding protein [Oligoflexia bacterium]|nr:ATP-binding protein [Oligoflexia bacterium]